MSQQRVFYALVLPESHMVDPPKRGSGKPRPSVIHGRAPKLYVTEKAAEGARKRVWVSDESQRSKFRIVPVLVAYDD